MRLISPALPFPPVRFESWNKLPVFILPNAGTVSFPLADIILSVVGASET
jgi:hypothetical protein